MSEQKVYPVAFVERMKSQLAGDFAAFINSLDTAPPTSVRLNNAKRVIKFDTCPQVSWCGNASYLPQRPSFTFDPLFHAGAYYVQEASSMFLEQAWKQTGLVDKNIKVLDLCAAPGGKSTHLLSLISSGSFLVSNELVPSRNKILQQNIIKWGYANCIVTQNKPEDFAQLPAYFDLILVDAPCSGEGLFRKDKDAIDEWSEKNVAMCAARQQDIIKHAAACLKPGGFLIYSTCTYEPVENDDNVAYLCSLGLQSMPLNISEFAGVTSTKYGLQFYPHRVQGEGFYIAVLQKSGSGVYIAPPLNSKSNIPVDHVLQAYLSQPGQFTALKRNELIFALPGFMSADFARLEKHLYIRNAGLLMGNIKGKDFLPAHDLALSNYLCSDLPVVELTEEEAITYLRGETPKLKSELRGWCLAAYQGFNLGWMKLMDGRLNNYFPKEWRILKRA